MAKLSNINGKFAVEDTGAIRFSDQTGTTGQILKSNGNSAPTWVDPNTVGTGPWLPLAGGIVSGATTFQNSLTIGGTAVFNGDMTLPAAADHFLIGAGSLQTTGRIKFGLPSWNNSIGLESYWMVMRSNSNEGYKFIDSGGNTYVQFNAGTNSSGANYSYFKGRIGIGTDSPTQAKLCIDGTQNSIYLTRGGASDTKWTISSDSASMYFQEAVGGYVLTLKENQHVGIGTTQPATKLHLGGTAPGDSIIRQDSTTSGTNWEIGERVAGKWQIFEDDGNTIVTTFMSTGNVGIGTTSPVTKLELPGSTTNSSVKAGTLEMQSYAVNNAWLADNLYFNGSVWKLRSAGYASQVYFGSGGDISFKRFATGNAGAVATPVLTMQLQSNGDVYIPAKIGIGTTSPGTYKLNVAGTGLFTGGLEMAGGGAVYQGQKFWLDGGGDTFLESPSSNLMTFTTGGTERMRIDQNGDISMNEGLAIQKMLSIGTNQTSGRSLLTIRNYDASLVNTGDLLSELLFTGRYYSGSSSQLTTAGINLIKENADGYGYGGALAFDTGGGAEAMRITSGGHTCFGSTSVANVVAGDGSAFGVESNNRMTLFQGTNSAAAMTIQAYYNPNGQVGRINTTGSTTQFLGSSDYRLKEDLQDFNGLDKVSKIPVYDFKWKTGESRSYGVMAHELQEVLPDAVSGEKDAVNEDESISPQGVDYSKIVPLLVKAIQELEARIKILENK